MPRLEVPGIHVRTPHPPLSRVNPSVLQAPMQLLNRGSVIQGVQELYETVNKAMLPYYDLAALRNELQPLFFDHPITQLLHQDPWTRHCFLRPTGQPADATLLDFVYGLERDKQGCTELGKRLLHANTSSALCESLRLRRLYAAGEIQRRVASGRPTRVLSFGCGHARELHDVDFTHPNLTYVGVEADPAAVERARLLFQSDSVNICQGDAMQAITHHLPLGGEYDFIFTHGMLDHLPTRIAKLFLARLFPLLRRGGVLSAPHFCPGLVERGYIEIFMDWFMFYREEDELTMLFDGIPPEEAVVEEAFEDANGYVLYRNLRRRQAASERLHQEFERCMRGR